MAKAKSEQKVVTSDHFRSDDQDAADGFRAKAMKTDATGVVCIKGVKLKKGETFTLDHLGRKQQCEVVSVEPVEEDTPPIRVAYKVIKEKK